MLNIGNSNNDGSISVGSYFCFLWVALLFCIRERAPLTTLTMNYLTMVCRPREFRPEQVHQGYRKVRLCKKMTQAVLLLGPCSIFSHQRLGCLKRRRKFVTTWINLEGIMLSEIHQTKKGKYCMISAIWGNHRARE